MKSSILKTVIVYDDPASRIRAQELSARVSTQLKEFESELYLWEFDALVHPETLADAAREASGADLIMISAADDAQLPVFVWKWLNRWMPCRFNHDAALVALPHPEFPLSGKERSNWCDALKLFAESCGIDFFCEARLRSGKDTHLRVYHNRFAPNSLLPEHVLYHQPGWQRWGTNE